MKIYVGITDKNWYDLLKESHCDEVIFWKHGMGNFKALEWYFNYATNTPRRTG